MNSLWQYRIRNLFSVTIICFSFLTVGIFLAISNNLQFTARQISGNLVTVFFLEPGLADPEVEALRLRVEESRLFSTVRLVDRQEALRGFKTRFPQLAGMLDTLESNPFPASIEAALRPENLNSGPADAFISRMRGEKGVEDIQSNRGWIERMESLSRLVRAVGFFLGGILLFASFFIISNVIKLNVMARRSEIEILRLVGATNSFIRIPFLLEGILLGVLGGLLSLGLLLAVTRLFPLYLGSSLGVLGELVRFRYLSLPQALALVSVGSALGFLGSFSSLSKFMKI